MCVVTGETGLLTWTVDVFPSLLSTVQSLPFRWWNGQHKTDSPRLRRYASQQQKWGIYPFFNTLAKLDFRGLQGFVELQLAKAYQFFNGLVRMAVHGMRKPQLQQRVEVIWQFFNGLMRMVALGMNGLAMKQPREGI
jgi:hypothetical protein